MYWYNYVFKTKLFIIFVGSHGMSGIFFQYDMNALKFIITEDDVTVFQLIVQIASCFGGLFIVFSKYINRN